MKLPIWCGVDELTVHGILGAHDWERRLTRDYQIDLLVLYDAEGAVATDNLSLAVDYASLAEVVLDCAKTGQFRLLETCAATMAERLFGEFAAIQELRLTVRKPQAIIAAKASLARLRARRTPEGWLALPVSADW
jgi:dihydroneopterin aldolase